MKLLNVEIHNILGVKDIRLDLDGHHLFLLGGGNAQGKSSTINAMLMALLGKSAMDNWPEVPLPEGEDEGSVTVNLSGDETLMDDRGFTAKLVLRRSPRSGVIREEFHLLDSAGEPSPEPRTLLKTLFHRGIDPMGFARMKPKEQKSVMEQLLKLDLEPRRQQRTEWYAERKALNKVVKELEVRVGGMRHFDDAPAEEISISECLEELTAAESVNAAKAEATARLNTLNAELAKHNNRLVSHGAEITSLTEKITSLTEKLKVLKAEAKKDAKACDEVSAEVEAKDAEVQAMESVDLEPIRAKMATAESLNEKVRSNATRKAKRDELKDKDRESHGLTEKMKALDDDVSRQLADAPWPIEGMSLDAEGVLINGLPFGQASQREKIMASTKIMVSLNPKLRLLVSEHGSDLDLDTMAVLDDFLLENDFQMLVEVVTRTEQDDANCTVVIKEGRLLEAAV